ncbi:MAG: sigma-54-dependent Fis family transcriptional regulator [Desulfurispora sp.]|uniref:sigma-54-dependent Fis family transcriptional regulator n=1 Tax=Desulfurispora sp. TaxID=3014275 RepID=UPI00404B7D58
MSTPSPPFLAGWQQFISGSAPPAHLDPPIARSWLRCRQAGLDPFLSCAPPASPQQTTSNDSLFLLTARPHLDYLARLLPGTSYVLVLSNPHGVILHTACTDPSAREIMQQHNFLPGACWSEAAAGTNAIGTALQERTWLVVAGAAHYCHTWHPYYCAAAPVYDPLNGELLGAVNISAFYRDLHPHTLGWVKTIANLLENEWFHKMRQHTLMQKPALDNCTDGQLTGADVSSIPVVARSPQLVEALARARQAAGTGLSVLITGETGTGKEVLASFIHQSSPRRNGPFVAVNCAALPPELAASELFGYLPGAFTGALRQGKTGYFQAADGGTLFLDEIADTPLSLQAALLRAVEQKQVLPIGTTRPVNVNVRIIAATSANLEKLMAQNQFRRDLYYRLCGIHIHLPPLRQRREDILPLAEAFLQQAAAHTGKSLTLSPITRELLQTYPWPGNVRELKNALESAAEFCPGGLITPDLLPALLTGPSTTQDASNTATEYLFWANSCAGAGKPSYNAVTFPSPGPFPYPPPSDPLLEKLAQTGGNIRQAARLLGIDRSTVYRRLRRLGLSARHWKNQSQ